MNVTLKIVIFCTRFSPSNVSGMLNLCFFLLSTNKIQLLLAGSRVDGLAVASQSRALYYTDSYRNEIVIMSLDGTSRKVLHSQNLSSPRAIVVDESSGSVSTARRLYLITLAV